MWSTGIRAAVVGVLTVAMFVPLFFVAEIIGERAAYSRQTIAEVGHEWGGPQTIAGPQLVIPVEAPITRTERREIVDPDTGKVSVETFEVTEIGRVAPLRVLPNTFDLTMETVNEERKRGIFTVPVYAAQSKLAFDFDIPEASLPLGPGETPIWEDAFLTLAVSSNRALRGEATLTVDGRALTLEPMDAAMSGSGGIVAPLGDPRPLGGFALALEFNGAGELLVAPVGRTSRVTMVSDWPHPSFTGAFLPDGSEIGDNGFTARWSVPHLARPLPQVSRADQTDAARFEAFGVRFFQPNDFYQRAYRAARYGVLFIGLTFLTVFLIEGRAERRTHPVQYILIGLAQSIFVLLMVSYAEQIGFGAAYALASGATIGLLVMFGYTALRLGRMTPVLAAALTLLYGVLFLILRSTDYALLAGSTLAFLALAGTMYATRNERWSAPPRIPRRAAQQPAEDGGQGNGTPAPTPA